MARLQNGQVIRYTQLINTLPLPTFLQVVGAPKEVLAKADELACSSVLLVNVEANHPTQRPENWIYVYDEDKWSTRINCTELLSPANAPAGKSGVQVEVYFSKYRPYNPNEHDQIRDDVVAELIEMGLVRTAADVEGVHTILFLGKRHF